MKVYVVMVSLPDYKRPRADIDLFTDEESAVAFVEREMEEFIVQHYEDDPYRVIDLNYNDFYYEYYSHANMGQEPVSLWVFDTDTGGKQCSSDAIKRCFERARCAAHRAMMEEDEESEVEDN